MVLLRYLTTGRSPKMYTTSRGRACSAQTSAVCAREPWTYSVSLLEGSFRLALVFEFEQRFLGIVKLEKINHLTWSRSACAPSLISVELGTDPFITQSLQSRLMQKRRAIVRMDEDVFDVWQRHSSSGDETAEVQLPALPSG